jgi:hypothetical protein
MARQIIHYRGRTGWQHPGRIPKRR